MSYVSFSPVDVTISEKMKSRASHFGIPIEELQKRAQDRWSLSSSTGKRADTNRAFLWEQSNIMEAAFPK